MEIGVIGFGPVGRAFTKKALAAGHTVKISNSRGPESLRGDLSTGRATLIAFGRPFISNPDLVSKLESNGALTPADSTTFYTPVEA